jgi:hypothetical protein
LLIKGMTEKSRSQVYFNVKTPRFLRGLVFV